MLIFGFTAGNATAAGAAAGPPAPGRTSVPAAQAPACDPAAGECDAVTQPPAAAPAPGPRPAPAPTGPASTTPDPQAPSGGARPTPQPSPGGGDVIAPSDEPAFVEQDPNLTGGAVPEAPVAGDPLTITPLTIPNFLIDQFEIPPFLLPIYQACGSEYGIPWQVLAAINRIETGFGTNLGVSSAGAQGWMQFMPATWAAYGVDANGDGQKDPFNPVDAICAAGNYLQASGYAEDPRGAIFAYNNADWYVDDILSHAGQYAQIPPEVISALTGLTEGARFPVAAEATYDGQIPSGQARRGNLAADEGSGSDTDRTSIQIEAEGGSPVIAVNDSIVRSIDPSVGTVVIEDAYGNRYTYAGLGALATVHPVPRRDQRGGNAGAPRDPAPAPAPTGAQEMGLAKAADKPDLQAQAETLVDQPRSEVVVGPGAGIIGEIASVLFAGGLNQTGAAGIIGNAYGESGLNPASVGSGGGGLWGFTVSPVSLSDVQDYAASTGEDWTDAALQTRFLLDHVADSTISAVNAAGSPEEAAEIFMVEFERPQIPRLEVRQAAARTVFDSGFTGGGTIEVNPAPLEAPASIPDPAPEPAVENPAPADPALTAAEDRRAEQLAISAAAAPTETVNTEDMRGRVYANPLRPQNQSRSTVEGVSTRTPASSSGISLDGKPGDYVIYDGSATGIYRFDPETTDLKPLREGSRVIAGTVLGRMADQPTAAMTFSIQPGGEDAPQIDPKPFLDGWKLLAASNIYGANGKDRFADRLGVGGVLLLSKSALQRRVLSDPKISMGDCDRGDVANGSIDRRILATLSFLSEKGYELLISSMLCGRESSITTSGYVSNHTYGSAVDIAAINGQVITSSTQGPGSLTDIVAREVLSLQGTMAPDEVISLLDYPQTAGFAMGDHDDHLHVGFKPAGDSPITGGSIAASLGAAQWRKLTERLGQIGNPEVATSPSESSLPVLDSGEGDRN
jgi:hypothetical protein